MRYDIGRMAWGSAIAKAGIRRRWSSVRRYGGQAVAVANPCFQIEGRHLRTGGGMLTIVQPSPAAASVGEYLVQVGALDADDLARAERLRIESKESLEAVLTKLGLVGEAEMAAAYAACLGIPLVGRDGFPADPVMPERFSRAFLKETRIVPIEVSDEHMVLAMANPSDDWAADAMAHVAGRPVRRCAAAAADIDAAFERLYGDGQASIDEISDEADDGFDDDADVDRLKDLASEAPVVRLVNLLINRAVEARASDIHIEPLEAKLRVRYRIDGILRDVETPPNRLRAAIVSRIKLMARLDIAEHRLPQDGRIRLAVRGTDVDFRVSTTPTAHGESVVLRILDRGSLELDFRALGFADDDLDRFLDGLDRPHGIILVTGPTGSGKTTTLYTSLLHLNTADRKILTIEDPVEYQLAGINQSQVKPQIGWTFANALRSYLRQDPDVMMVGEIRDLETAQIAVQAALTGHIVLSTLHTNDAAGAVARLLDMGVDDYLLTSSVNMILAQRLVRRICRDCRQTYAPAPDVIEKLGLARLTRHRPVMLFRAMGCAACQETGYAGRMMVYEILPISDGIRQLILKSAAAQKIRDAAIAEGMQSMYRNGLRRALSGETTLEEVFRVVGAT